MNTGKAITEAMREQRARDYTRMCWTLPLDDAHLLRAWIWWGWYVHKPGGIGRPGLDYGRP